jgi:endogenous inhibitor of DNA gyrase (YacG/DUF329 family)
LTDQTIPVEMERRCTKCGQPVSAKRVIQNSYYCSDRCRLIDRRARRQWKASRFCRLCGVKKRVRVKRQAEDKSPANQTCAGGAQITTKDSKEDIYANRSQELVNR